MRGHSLAVVLGDLDLVSALGMGGLRCLSVADPDDPVRHSRFVVGSIADAFSADPEQLVSRLLDATRACPRPPVLYYQTDADLLVVSRHRDLLSAGFRFVLPNRELVEDLVDKGRFRRLAKDRGLPVPASALLHPTESDPRPDLRYPVVLKPLNRADLARLPGSGKALAVASPGELGQVWNEVREQGMGVLVQEMIPGPETAVESYHAYVDGAGAIVGEFTGAKLRTWPRDLGYSTAVRITSAPDVVVAGRQLVESLGFRGVLKADFKRDPTGRLHLLEVNPRFSLWHHLGAAAGVNLPALVHADLTGRRRPSAREVEVGRTWCQVGGDRRAARASGVGTATWIRWVLQTSARAEGRWSDPAPLLRGVLLPKITGQRPTEPTAKKRRFRVPAWRPP